MMCYFFKIRVELGECIGFTIMYVLFSLRKLFREGNSLEFLGSFLIANWM